MSGMQTVTERVSEERAGALATDDGMQDLAWPRLLSARLSTLRTLSDGLDEMLAAAIDMLGADFGNIQLLDRVRGVMTIESQCGFEPAFLASFREVSAADLSACGRALRAGERVIIEDVEVDASYAPFRSIAREAGYRAVQSTPLLGRKGEPLGAISTHFRSVHRPSESQLRQLDFYARQTSDFIERCRADAALERAQAQLEAELAGTKLLAGVSAAPEENIQTVYEKIMDAAVGIMRSDFASMQMLYPERGQGGELRLLAYRGFPPQAAEFWEWVRTDSKCTCGIALATGQRCIDSDVVGSRIMAGTPDQQTYLQAGIHAVQSTPLVSRDGRLVGMISTHWKQPHQPSERELRLLDLLARQAADLIDRKKAEQALRESEERFRGVFDSTAMGVFVCDREGIIQQYNRRAVELWGREPRRGVEKQWGSAELFLPYGTPLPHEQSPIMEVLRSGQPALNVEVLIGRPNSSRLPALVSFTALKDAMGRITGAVGSFIDITERKEAERDLREREAWLAGQREALEEAVNGAPLATSLGMLVRTAVEAVGQGARAGFYLANDEGTALRHVVGMPADYAEAVDGFTIGPDSLACGLATATGQPVLTSDVRRDPLWQPWLWMAEKFDYRACWSFPIHTAARRFVGTLAIYSRQPREATQRDLEIASLLTGTASIIISRHEEAETRQRTEQALRESEHRLARELVSMQRLHELSVRLAQQDNLDEVVGEVMAAAGELLGAKRCTAQLLDPKDHSLRLVACAGFDQAFADRFRVVTPDDFTTCAAALGTRERVIVEDLAADARFAELAALTLPMGIRAVMSTPLLASDGALLGVFTTYWDIPHSPSEHQLRMVDLYVQKAARQVERRIAEEALRTANRAKDRFLAVLSHELRTPLTPVLMSAAVLAHRDDVPRDVRDTLAMIHRNVELQGRLIDDLLDLSRIASGKLRLNLVVQDVNELVRRACDTCRSNLRERGIQLYCDLQPDALDVMGDAARLQQVFWNLLNNAAKFTREGGQVFVRTETVSGGARVTVRDTGIGIDREDLQRIFDAFEQADGRGETEKALVRQCGGMGLGLAICRALVEQHRGTISAHSEGKDKGSTFVVELPTAPLQVDSPETRQVPTQSTQRSPAFRVLVVEDHPDTAEVLRTLLTSAGHRVEVASTAADALTLTADHAFDILISDLGLPDMTGYELMRQIKQRGPIKGIAISGYGMEEDIKRSHEAGFSDHLVKPVRFEQIDQSFRLVTGRPRE